MTETRPGNALTPADIGEYLASADDFAFEREVYHVAKGLGFAAEHAALYTDPVTDKPRQFDIRAFISQGENRIALAIECKGLSLDFPLVVSCVPRASHESYHEVLSAAPVMGLNESYTRVERIPSPLGTGAYQVREGVGKSMRQVRRETRGLKAGQMVSGDDVFDKWMQALASIAEMVDNGADILSSGPQQKLRHIAFVPCLVVSDSSLWVADYSARGELSRPPFQVDHVDYYVARKYPLRREQVAFTISHLRITTRTQIRIWLENIARGGATWQELFGG